MFGHSKALWRPLSALALVMAATAPSAPARAQFELFDLPTNGTPLTSQLHPGISPFSEDEARERLGRSGYSEVGALTRTEQGIWLGEARYRGQDVRVGIDHRGSIMRVPSL